MASPLNTKINSYALERGIELSEAYSTTPTRTGSSALGAAWSFNGTALTYQSAVGPINGQGSWQFTASTTASNGSRFRCLAGNTDTNNLSDGDYGVGIWVKFNSLPTGTSSAAFPVFSILGTTTVGFSINITGSTPLMFTYANATPLNPIIVINNFISSNGSNLSIVSSANLKFYNNSFSSLSTSRSVSITNTYTNYDFKNNIFKNAGGKFYYFQSSSGNIVNTAQFFSNNNCFYNATSTQFNINSTVYNLSSWQSNFSLDVSSIVGDPQFNSSNDLHINNATILNGAGIPIPEVTLDFDQQLRDLNTPDIGADEFEINASTYENIAFLGVISPDSSSCVLNNQIEVSVVNHSTFPITSSHFIGEIPIPGLFVVILNSVNLSPF
jgi:hypothetical protein